MQESSILIVSGTNRPGNMTRKVADLVRPLYEGTGATVDLLDISDLPASMYAPESYAEKPAELMPFTQRILNSKGMVVLTPEYNGSLPGALKYFIDMLPFPESFEGRPVAFIGISAGIWGGLRPVEHLQQIFGYRNAYVYPNRVFLPRIYEIFKDLDSFRQDLAWQLLNEQATGFVDFARSLEKISTPA